MIDLLSQADRNLGRLDGMTLTLPNPDMFVFMYVRKEAVLSSQIEGTQASLIDVLEYENNIQNAKNPEDIEEVVNYIFAVNKGLERLQQLPLSLCLIKEIHSALMQGVRGNEKSPGEFRTTQNWIGPQGCLLTQASYIPPPPHEMMIALDNWEKFLYDDRVNMPILLKVGIAHAQFETIHPFLDGNGRIGRLLITFLLCEAKIMKWPSLYISHYFKEYKSEYYTRLQDTRDKGDWEGWLKFFLRGISEVAQEATKTTTTILQIREDTRRLISEKLTRSGAGNAMALLSQLFYRPVVNVQQVADIIDMTYATANYLASDLERIGILKEITGGGRNRKYAFEPYWNLFADSQGQATPSVKSF
ncbi:MAG TPA: Fic family protein [Stellaceae bacterium]|nr:Fic family protein [Stellaceae bacterium]